MLSSIKEINNEDLIEKMKKSDKPIIDALNYRRTIRNYDIDYKIPQEHLDEIVHAGMFAPTACNSQPYDLVVVRNVAKLEEVSKLVLDNLPEHFKSHVLERKEKHGVKNVVTCDANCIIFFVKNERQIKDFVELDVGISCMAMMTAALQFRLDTMCLGFFRTPIVEKYFGFKEGSVPLALAVGKVKGDRIFPHKDLISKITYID